MHAADYFIVAAYLAIVLALGLRSRAGTQSEEAFFLADRRLGRLRQFFFNFGHSTDANTAVSTVSFTYSEGASGAWLQLQLIFLNPYYWFMSVWFRRARLTTSAELLEERLESPGLAQVYALFQIGVAIIGIGFSHFVTYKVTAALLDGGAIPPFPFYCVLAAVVGIYVAMGGLEAAVLNQIFQGTLVLVFSVILLPFGFRALGPAGLHAHLAPRMFQVFAAATEGQFTFWAVVAILLVSIVQINGNIINMGLSGAAKDEQAARFGAVSGTYGKRIMIVLWVFVGLIAAGLRSGDRGLADPDLAWGTLSRDLLGPGFLGLMLVGLLAANMASVASKTMAISALFVRNLYRPWMREPAKGDDVRAAQWAGIAALALSVLAAMGMKHTMAVTKLILTINLPFGAAILMLFFWRRLTRPAVWWCVILTGALIILEPLGARATGDVHFSVGAWLLDLWLPSGAAHGGGARLAAQFFFDVAFPFAVLLFVSGFTRPPSPAVVDYFFGKLKTPVCADRAADAAALEETRRNPRRFESLRLFPGSAWEFTRWDRADLTGFVVCCALSGGIILFFWGALRYFAGH